MLKNSLLVLAGVALGAVSSWAMRSDPQAPDEEPDPSPESDGGPADRSDGSRREAPATLSECRRALVGKEIEARAARATAARAVARQIFAPDEEGAPRSEGGSETPPGAGDPQSAAPDPEERRRFHEAREKARKAVVDELRVTEQEEQALADIVCTQREDERSLLYEFSEGRIGADDFFDAMSAEHGVAAQNLRHALGKGRYRQLRRVGGIGFLSQSLCGRR